MSSRKGVRFPLTCSITLTNDSGSIAGTLQDISIVGFGCTLPQEPSQDSQVSINLPGSAKPIDASVHLIWAHHLQDGYQAGFAFSELSDKDLEAIKSYITESLIERHGFNT